MIRLRRVQLGLALAAAFCLGCGRESALDRVVLISVDTLRADRVGAYGARDAHTRTFDAIAAEGVRFEVALSPVPLTLPAHASLMTGLDPTRHGVHGNSGFRLEAGIPTLAERMGAAGFTTAAFVGALVLDRQFGLARGFDHYDERMSPRRSGKAPFAERAANEAVDAALEWLDIAPDRFFLWVHLYDPHQNYDPPKAFLPDFPSDPYRAEIAFADAEAGRLLDAVRARWGPEGLLWVMTSDHGESRGEHGEPNHGHSIYDATQRLPLVMSGPGVPQGLTVDAPVRLVDVAPTILALAGARSLLTSSGRDLRPVWEGHEPTGRVAYLETLATHFDFGWSPLFGVRTDRYKYIRAPTPELYDLRVDPGETVNLADESPELVASLDRALEQRLADAARLPEVGGPDPKQRMHQLERVRGAQALQRAGLPAAAYAQLAEIEGESFALSLHRARAALAARLPAEALKEARAAAALRPDSVRAVALVGSALEAQGRYEEARRAYRQALERDPAEPSALIGLGTIAETEGDAAGAEGFYRRAADSASAPAEAHWRLAALALERGEGREAEAGLLLLEAEALTGAEAAIRLASAERAIGRTREARERLEIAISQSPRDPDLRRALAAQLFEAGQSEAALRALDRALVLAPHDPAVQDDLARALIEHDGDLDRALAAADRGLARARGPLRAHLLYIRALALEALGRPDQAAEAVTEALTLAAADPQRTADWLEDARRLGRRLGAADAARPGGF